MGRAIFGLFKGLLIGGAVGYCLYLMGNPGGVLVYLACGLVGAVVGLICGRAPWRAETVWTPILKMLVGCVIGVGLYALGHHLLPAQKLAIEGISGWIPLRSGTLLVPVIGALYGLFVELDDGGSTTTSPAAGGKPPSASVDL